MEFERQLAAIMFTDIQGYTSLMQTSEDKAIALRNRHREVFEQVTSQFHGKIINYYGDGTLSIFKSAVEAVKCGCALQKLYQKDPIIPVRIGIHVGDIVLTEDDIIGDSVNLAARVESLGVVGSVLISEKVVSEIGNQRDLPVAELGSFHFKNDAQARKIYAIDLPGLVVPKSHELSGKLEKVKRGKFGKNEIVSLSILILVLLAIGIWQWTTHQSVGIERLAVLPFSNLMNNSEQDYFVDGVHEALISKLQLAGVSVTPHTSILSYRNVEKSVRQISTELGVDGLLEGSVLRSGDKVEIAIRLVSGREERYLWGQAFEGDLGDIMFIYNDMTRAITSEIKYALSPTVKAGMNRTQRVDSKAYDLYLQGRASLNQAGWKNVQQAIDLFKESISIDAQLGPAYTGLVEAYLLQGFGAVSPQEAFANFRIYAQKAIELDEKMAQDHHQRAMVKLFSDWDWEGAEQELLAAIEKDPSWSTYDSYCQLMWAMGHLDRSVKAGEDAVAADSMAHFAHCDLSWAYFYNNQIEAARKQLDETIELAGTDCPYHSALGFRLEVIEAEEAGRDLQPIIDKITESDERPLWLNSLLGWLYGKTGQKEKALALIEMLHNNSQIDYLDPVKLVPIYIELQDYDQAFQYLDEAYGQRSFLLLFTIKSDPRFEPIREDPRYQRLLNKMGLSNL